MLKIKLFSFILLLSKFKLKLSFAPFHLFIFTAKLLWRKKSCTRSAIKLKQTLYFRKDPLLVFCHNRKIRCSRMLAMKLKEQILNGSLPCSNFDVMRIFFCFFIIYFFTSYNFPHLKMKVK